jgi:parallel beta-helix repeat protein
VDGQLLRQVLELGEMKPGTFCADPLQARALYVWLADGGGPSKHKVAASVRPTLMHLTGSYIIVRNLRFLYACNSAQHGALVIEGAHNLVEDCVVEWTNGAGAALRGEQNIARRLVSRNNGQMGMSGHGADNRMEECRLVGNNVKGFSKGWEAGGIKVALSRRFHIVRCLAEKNDGPGFWFDIDNREEVIEGCTARENDGPGIFVEISETATVRNNLCVRNGLKDEKGAWGHAGIALGEAMNCLVEHNVCVGNRSGIAVRQQNIRMLKPDPSRGRETEKRYYSQGHVFRNNISAFNREWQFVLFGDNPFFGLHPTIPKEKQPPPSPEDMALYDPDQRQWRMERNLYYAAGGQGLICWGAPWRPKHKRYKDLSELQREHKLEEGTLVADPLFVDVQKENFALSPASPARGIGAGLEK